MVWPPGITHWSCLYDLLWYKLHELLHPGHKRAKNTREQYLEMGDREATRQIREQHKHKSRALPERNMQEQTSRPLDIQWEYQLLDSTSPGLREYIVDRLMPAAAAVLKRAIRVWLQSPLSCPQGCNIAGSKFLVDSAHVEYAGQAT